MFRRHRRHGNPAPVETMRAVAAVGRAAGLIGHIREEMENPIVPSVVEFINNIEYRDPD